MKLAYMLFGMAVIDLPLIVLAFFNAHWSVAILCTLPLLTERARQFGRIRAEDKLKNFT